MKFFSKPWRSAAATRESEAKAEELSAQLATISSEIDGYISLPSEAKLPAPLLAAAFQEYEAYAGRPPADEHEACHVQVHVTCHVMLHVMSYVHVVHVGYQISDI